MLQNNATSRTLRSISGSVGKFCTSLLLPCGSMGRFSHGANWQCPTNPDPEVTATNSTTLGVSRKESALP